MTSEPGLTARPCDEQKPQRAHAAEEMGIGARAGSGFGLGEGLQLTAPDQGREPQRSPRRDVGGDAREIIVRGPRS